MRIFARAQVLPRSCSHPMDATDESFYEIKARIIAVLANPKRLEIIDLLNHGERTVSDLATSLGIAQAATSQHLAVMRKAGVVETRKDGNFVFYRLPALTHTTPRARRRR